MPVVSKDPDATLDWQIDWSKALVSGDSISTSNWTVPTGITKSAESATSLVTTIFLSGGTAGTVYPVVNRIVSANGVTDDRTIHVVVEEH